MRPKVAFICVRNSCRSQIAEALGKHLASDVYDSYSAGTDPAEEIDRDAVRLVKEIYGIDMRRDQHPKTVSDIPPADIVIAMGCNVACRSVPCGRREDWGIPDPAGADDDVFIATIGLIEKKVIELRNALAATK